MPNSWRSTSLICLCLLLPGCKQPPPADQGARQDTLAVAPDLQLVAGNLVKAALVAAGDQVVITGSVRDAALLEDLAIETMKAGGQPLIALGSEQLARRSYDEVPASYDTMPPKLDLALINVFDVQIAVDVGETEGLLAGVPQERRTARAKAAEPANAAFLRRGTRTVSLGNGIYPTATLAGRLGIGQTELTTAFWKAAGVPPETVRAKGEALLAAFAGAGQVTLTHANGTSLTFAVDANRGIISDGAITPENARRGGAAASTWIPAGELILPARPGTAEGTVVIDRLLWDGKEIHNLTLAYSKGRLTSMTADNDFAGLKAAYDAAGGAKDQFGYVDIGLNPEASLPVGTGRTVWMAPGAIAVGLGDNRFFGGNNASDFGLAGQLGGATLKAGETVLVENGTLK